MEMVARTNPLNGDVRYELTFRQRELEEARERMTPAARLSVELGDREDAGVVERLVVLTRVASALEDGPEPDPDSSPFEEPSGYDYVEKGFDFVDRWHDRRAARRKQG